MHGPSPNVAAAIASTHSELSRSRPSSSFPLQLALNTAFNTNFMATTQNALNLNLVLI